MLTQVQLVQGGIRANISLWKSREGLPTEGWEAECAREVLSTWMHLKRFRPELIDPELVTLVNDVVARDRQELFETSLTCEVLTGFAEEANRLWKQIELHCEDDGYEPGDGPFTLDDHMGMLLVKMDNYVLYTTALNLLIRSGPWYSPEQRKRLDEHLHAAKEACSYFDRDADNFALSVGPMVIGMLEQYQTDMFKQDVDVIVTIMHLWKVKKDCDALWRRAAPK